MKKLWYIYTVECYSVIKRNAFESDLMRWMNLGPIIQREVSQKEKDKYHILMHISPLFSSSILGTYQPGEFIFQCHTFLPIHTVHGALRARILKWFAIPFSREPNFFRTLHRDLSVLGGPTGHVSYFH